MMLQDKNASCIIVTMVQLEGLTPFAIAGIYVQTFDLTCIAQQLTATHHVTRQQTDHQTSQPGGCPQTLHICCGMNKTPP